jgi:diguanylate cyclase (GGDEF)-like protein/PAS domain S-box-containing protein
MIPSGTLEARVALRLTPPVKVVSVGAEIEALLGDAPAEYLSGRLSLRDRVHPGDRDLADALFDGEGPLGPGVVHLRIRHANGRIRCVRCVYERRRDERAEVVLDLLLQDSTTLPRPTARAASSAFRAMMENSDDFIFFKDRNHVLTGASQSLVALCAPATHWTELLGRTDYDLFPEAYADVYYELEKQVFAGVPVAHEIQETLTKDGRRGWVDNRKYPIVDERGEIIGLYGIARDISEPHAARRALHEFFEQPISVNLIAGLDGRIHRANLGWTRTLGYAPQDLVGRSFWELIHPDDQAVTESEVAKLASGQKIFHFENRYRRLDGSYCAIAWSASVSPVDQLIYASGIDVTGKRQAEERLKLVASVFTYAHEGIIITDPTGTILDVNEMFCRITGYSREEAIGSNPKILRSGRQSRAFFESMWSRLRAEHSWSGEIWNRRKNGEVYPELLTISAVRDDDGRTLNYVGLFSDITLMKEQQQQLERSAHFDALTGLPNRVLLADRLQQAMLQSQRRERLVAVAYLDLDGFKAVNDTHGHEVGDALLVLLGQRMRAALRKGDTLSRLGGDEFVAVISDLPTAADCEPVMARLLRAASDPALIHDVALHVTASIGVAIYPHDPVDAEQLLRHADQAMYIAKQQGKNRHHVFDVQEDSSFKLQRDHIERVRGALARSELVLYWQPKVNMKTGALIGAEALIRWQDPTRGLILPGNFLPYIEGHALFVEVGNWVLEAALAQASEWLAAGLSLPISVNVGAQQLRQPDFAARLQALLTRYAQVPPSHLELEVLETSALRDFAESSALMRACMDFGVRFAIDDFGTGYSSLTYLRRLPVEVLKIDRSFVGGMLEDPDDLAIVEGVIALARSFRRQVIAEGVETVAHGLRLLALGCELAQGYGIARPMPAADIPAWVARWRLDPSWTLGE